MLFSTPDTAVKSVKLLPNAKHTQALSKLRTQKNVTRSSKLSLLDLLSDLYRCKNCPHYPGESLSLTDHMLQCAHLAEEDNQSPEIIAGALLHDIGHLLSLLDQVSDKQLTEVGQDNSALLRPDEIGHEFKGARLLTDFFTSPVTESIRLHVLAKRYLCTVDKYYINDLSHACAQTLESQGGLMSTGEVIKFEQHPHLEVLLAVRRLDDRAIQPSLICPEFDHYRPVLLQVLQ